MEPSQFDEFTKAMATPTSRRQAIKTFIASTFGGILALSGLGTAFARGCHPACTGGKTCCGGKCVDTKKDPNNCGVCGTKCRSGLCVNGLCCPDGAVKCGNSCCSFTCCGGNTCTNLQSDKNNCGACGNVCPSGDICKNGKCVSVCASGCKQLCNGTCALTCSHAYAACICGNDCQYAKSGDIYCWDGSGPGAVCFSDCDCPKGQFCSGGSRCIGACC